MSQQSSGSVGPLTFLKRGIALYLSSFRQVVPIALAAAVINAGWVLVLDLAAQEERLPGMGALVMGLACSVVVALLGLIIMRRLDSIARGLLADLNDEFHVALARLLPFLAASLLYGAMVMLGIVMFIVPGVYLAIAFGFYGWFMVLEAKGPIRALEASFRLVEGQWGYAFGRVLLMLLTLIGLLIIPMIPVTVLLQADAALPGLSSQASQVLVESLVNGLFQPLGMALGLVLFYDMKSRKIELESAAGD